MTEENNELAAAAISDRGLSEKRPLNEDSYICDMARRLFAVADGVGGAQAGEVASQTAMEVMDEAFRHHLPDVDNEDLMEIAIQRANSSIHSMSREHPKMARMATTIVALHLDGNVATIGHVGDSRLYRISPGGKLFRETRDHSVVEEEVRAGRMTPEQAINHPSRNVISRALGAEETVEVDMKTVEVVPGTAFLLCSDGITRHIPDDELRHHLISTNTPDAIVAEMKRICYERGAEDNLTAIVVRLQGATQYDSNGVDADDERTVSTPRLATTTGLNAGSTGALAVAAATAAEVPETPAPTTSPTSNGVAAAAQAGAPAAIFVKEPGPGRPAPKKPGFFSTLLRLMAGLLVVAIVGAGAFVGGVYFQKRNPNNQIATTIMPSRPADSPSVLTGNNNSVAPEGPSFEADRREVDRNPAAMVTKLAERTRLKSDDPVGFYLYGRALLLTHQPSPAMGAFKTAGGILATRPELQSVRVENALLWLTAATAIPDENNAKMAKDDLEAALRLGGGPGSVTTPGASQPSGAPGATPVAGSSPQK